MKELWKVIEEFPEYEISNFGNVKSNTKHGKGKILSPSVNGVGYYFVHIKNYEGKYKTRQIHGLVAKAFLPNPENKKVVHHKDWNKLNNMVTNLMWVTSSENRKFDYEAGVGNTKMSFPGELNPRSKLSRIDIENIRKDRESGMTYLAISKKYKMSESHIGNICRRYCWKETN